MTYELKVVTNAETYVTQLVLSKEPIDEDFTPPFIVEVDPHDNRLWVIPQLESIAKLNPADCNDAINVLCTELKNYGGKQFVDLKGCGEPISKQFCENGFSSPTDTAHEGIKRIRQVSVNILKQKASVLIDSLKKKIGLASVMSDVRLGFETGFGVVVNHKGTLIDQMEASKFAATKIEDYRAKSDKLLAMCHNAIPMALINGGKLVAFCRVTNINVGHGYIGDTLIDEGCFGGKGLGWACLYQKAAEYLESQGISDLSLVVPSGFESVFDAGLGSVAPKQVLAYFSEGKTPLRELLDLVQANMTEVAHADDSALKVSDAAGGAGIVASEL